MAQFIFIAYIICHLNALLKFGDTSVPFFCILQALSSLCGLKR